MENIEDMFSNPPPKTEKKQENNQRGQKDKPWESPTHVAIDKDQLHRPEKTFTLSLADMRNISRDTIDRFVAISKYLFNNGYTFRATMYEANKLEQEILKIENSKVEKYLLFKTKDSPHDDAVMDGPNVTGYGIAANYNKRYSESKEIAKKMLAQNVHLLYGDDCSKPVDILLIDAKKNIEALGRNVNFKDIGNTFFSLFLASKGEATTVFNALAPDVAGRIKDYVNLKK
jgi:hypothetical protein